MSLFVYWSEFYIQYDFNKIQHSKFIIDAVLIDYFNYNNMLLALSKLFPKAYNAFSYFNDVKLISGISYFVISKKYMNYSTYNRSIHRYIYLSS